MASLREVTPQVYAKNILARRTYFILQWKFHLVAHFAQPRILTMMGEIADIPAMGLNTGASVLVADRAPVAVPK